MDFLVVVFVLLHIDFYVAPIYPCQILEGSKKWEHIVLL